jgi:RimJ/RimL family protein N-acetyltransferase
MDVYGQAPGLAVKQLAPQALASIKADLQARRFEQARARLEEVATLARQDTSLLSEQQQAWVARHQWVLAPLWSEPVQHGVVSLRRCGENDAEFFRAVFQDTAFTNSFNRQRPWSGDLGRALHNFGHEPPALLKMPQGVVCLRSEPVGLISLSHLDLTNARAEFSIGFPKDMSAGISHKACLLAMHFAFSIAGLNKLYGYVYEGNDHALQSALRIGFQQGGGFWLTTFGLHRTALWAYTQLG